MRGRPAWPQRRVVAAALLAIAIAVSAGACGSRQPASLSAGAGLHGPDAEADAADARRALLTTTDLPGYDVGTAADADPIDPKVVQDLEACAGTAATLGGDGQSAVSPGFFKGKTVVVSSLAVVAGDQIQANAAMTDLSQARAAGCLTGLFRAVLNLDQLPGTSATTELVRTTGGPQSVTWRTTIQVTSGAQTVSAYSDLTFLRSGRTLGAVFAFQVGDPYPAAQRAQLVSAMAARTS